jgi:alkylhydroperoxidase family enzyme
MPARIPLAPLDEAERLAVEIGIPAVTGRLNVFRMMALDPVVARAIFTQHNVLRHGGKLPDLLRELIIMRIAWLEKSEYEWAQHWTISQKLGIDAQVVLAVRNWRDSDHFGSRECAVLAAVDDTLESGMIADNTWQACVSALGSTDAMIELVAAIGHWSSLARLFRSFAVPLEDGMTSWPPDGLVPS